MAVDTSKLAMQLEKLMSDSTNPQAQQSFLETVLEIQAVVQADLEVKGSFGADELLSSVVDVIKPAFANLSSTELQAHMNFVDQYSQNLNFEFGDPNRYIMTTMLIAMYGYFNERLRIVKEEEASAKIPALLDICDGLLEHTLNKIRQLDKPNMGLIESEGLVGMNYLPNRVDIGAFGYDLTDKNSMYPKNHTIYKLAEQYNTTMQWRNLLVADKQSNVERLKSFKQFVNSDNKANRDIIQYDSDSFIKKSLKCIVNLLTLGMFAKATQSRATLFYHNHACETVEAIIPDALQNNPSAPVA